MDAVICTKCGRQVESINKAESNSPIVINNNNNNSASSSASVVATRYAGAYHGRECNKWTALILCLFLGWCGGHKFYEGKIGTGIFYILTFGICCLGPFIDFFNILGKPNPYYVR
ncbi:MAG: TM2 domain-containing protein [Clostridia bacterium]|nr:TM2 domain-containing protein [Clostridia bacterium]